MKKYLTPINLTFFAALSLTVLVAFGIVPRAVAFLVFGIYGVFMVAAPMNQAVSLFLRAIPFFIAMPITEGFDNFNMWRLLLLILFLRWLLEDSRWKKFIFGFFAWVYPKDPKTLSFKSKTSPSTHPHAFKKKGFGVFRSRKQIPSRGSFNLSSWFKQNKIEGIGMLFLAIMGLSVIVGQGAQLDIGAGFASIKRFIFVLNGVFLFVLVRHLVKQDKNNFYLLARNFAYSGLLAVFFGFVQFIAAYFQPAWVFHYWWGQVVSLGMYGQEWADIATDFGNTWFSYSGETLRLRMFSTFPDSHSFPMYVIMALPAMFVIVFKKLSNILFLGPVKDPKTLSFKSKTSPSTHPHAFKKKGFGVFNGAYSKKNRSFFSKFKQFLPELVLLSLINLALILSGTRGIWIASFAIVLVGVLFASMRVPKKFIIASVVLFGLFLAIFPVYFGIVSFPQFQDTGFATDAASSRIRSLVDFGETSNAGRIHIWKTTVQFMAEHPSLAITGVGVGNYPMILTEPVSSLKAGSSAHNLYLHLASTIGIPGLLAFIWFCIEITRKSIAFIKERSSSVEAVYLAVMLFSLAWIAAYLMTDAALYDERAMLAFMAMIGISAGMLGKKNTK